MRLLALLLVCAPLTTWAHGASYQRLADADAVVLGFSYAIGEPMAGAEVTVTAPSARVFQRGETDAQGQFAFVPDRPGDWRITAEEGGHEVRAQIAVGAASAGGDAAAAFAVPPRWLLYGLLASLALNAALVSLVLARRRQ